MSTSDYGIIVFSAVSEVCKHEIYYASIIPHSIIQNHY